MLLVVVFCFLHTSHSISTGFQNGTAEILWNLSNFAVQSRQYGNRDQYQNQYGLGYQSNYGFGQDYKFGKFKKRYPQKYPQRYQYQYQYPSKPFRPLLDQQSFMEALESVSRNDELQCVPKLLCEVTAGGVFGNRQASGLPFNLNMESVIGLLSIVNLAEASPILNFGKAALLGYTSKGNSAPCNYAYPRCPTDPDRLVQYLNNHNGGFFRFFNGVSPQGIPQGYPQYGGYGLYQPQKRIQNKPVQYVPTNNFLDNSPGVKFPNNYGNGQYGRYRVGGYRSEKNLRFPADTQPGYRDPPFRKPKELPHDIYFYQNDQLDYQRPLPNHVASPMIFPDRTGTGDLRLDPEELLNSPSQNNPYPNDALYYPNFPNTYRHFPRGGKGLTFP